MGLIVFRLNPIPVILDQLNQMLNGLGLRYILLYQFFFTIQVDFPVLGTHVAVIGIGQLTGSVHDASHHPYFQVLQVREMLFYHGDGGLQVKKRTPTAGTRNKLGLAGSYPCSLQQAKSVRIHLIYIDSTLVAYHDTVPETIQQNSAEVHSSFELYVLRLVLRVLPLQDYRHMAISIQ